MEDARRNGVPTEFDADGCPIFTGPRHRNKYLRSVGMFDRSAGYGDPAPNVAGGTISERQATEMVREMCDAVGAAFGIDE
jgi:hypothetical protein